MLRTSAGAALGLTGAAVLAACGETSPTIVTKEVAVETVVIKEVPVQTVVTRTEIKEVPVQTVVTQTQIKEVPVEKIVTREKIVTKTVPIERVVTREVIKEVPAERETVKVRWQEVWSDAFQPTVEEKMIPGFEARFPYIQIENERIEEAQMYEIYLTQIAGGDPPDVIQIQESRVPQFAARGGIIPLDAFIGKAGLNLSEIFYAGEWPKGSWLGVQYALPLDNTGAWYLFWWNKDTFEEIGLDPDTPPTTWTELEEMALKATVREDGEITRHGMFVPEMIKNAGTMPVSRAGNSRRAATCSPRTPRRCCSTTRSGFETLRGSTTWCRSSTTDGTTSWATWMLSAPPGPRFTTAC